MLFEPRMPSRLSHYFNFFTFSLCFIFYGRSILVSLENVAAYDSIICFAVSFFLAYLIQQIHNMKKTKLVISIVQEKANSQFDIYDLYLHLCFNRKNSNQIELEGMIEIHKEKCEQIDCPCKNEEIKWGEFNNNSEKELEEYSIDKNHYAKNIIINLISINLIKFSRDFNVHILEALVFLYVKNNCFLALCKLSDAESKSINLFGKIQVMYLRNFIKRIISQENLANALSIDINQVLKYLKYYNSFLDLSDNCIGFMESFWRNLKEPIPNLVNMDKLKTNISLGLHEIQKNYEKIMHINCNCHDFLFKYALFTKFAIHNDIEVFSLLNKIIEMRNKQTILDKSESYFSPFNSNCDTMMITCSGDKSSLGKVLDVNSQVQSILGYSRKEIIGISLNSILPPPVAAMHDKWVLNFFETKKVITIGKIISMPLRTNQGFYLECSILKMINPEIKKNLQFILFIRKAGLDESLALNCPIKCHPSLIICETSLKILGIDKYCHKNLGISPKYFEQNNDAHLDLIFEELAEFEVVKNYEKSSGGTTKISLSSIQNISEDNTIDAFQKRESMDKNSGSIQSWITIKREKFGSNINTVSFLKAYFCIIQNKEVEEEKIQIEKELIANENNINSRRKHKKILKEENKEKGFGKLSVDSLGKGNFDDILSQSQTSSTDSSTSSNKLLQEFKQSLYSKEYPQSLRFLHVSIFISIIMLIVMIIVDFCLTQNQVTKLEKLNTIYVDSIQKVDLVLETCFSIYNIYYFIRDDESPHGIKDEEKFKEYEESVMIDSSELIKIQNLYYQYSEYLSEETLIEERKLLKLNYVDNNGKEYNRFSIYNMAIIDLCYNALLISKLPTISEGRTQLKEKSSNISKAISYIKNNCLIILKDQSMVSHTTIENYFNQISSQEMRTLIITSSVSIAVIVLCFLFTVYNILTVGKQKSQIFMMFAELTNENIEEILIDILSINLREKKFESSLKSIHNATKKDSKITPEEIEIRTQQKVSHQSNLTQENLLVPTEPKDTEIPTMDAISRENDLKKKSKQKALKSSDSSLKKKAIIQVLLGIMFINALFGLNIFLSIFNSDNYEKLGNIEIILVSRNKDLTELNTIIFDSLVFNDTFFFESDNPRGLDKVYSEIYEFENQALQFASSPPSMFNDYSKVALELDSKKLCKELKTLTSNIMINECETRYGGILNQGLRNSIFYFLRDLFEIERKFYNSNRNSDTINTLLNSEEFHNAIELKDYFLQPALEYLLKYYETLVDSFFKFVEAIAIAKLSIIIIFCIALYLLSYKFILNRLFNEIWMAKGMLNLIPTSLILSNQSVKDFFVNSLKHRS